MKKRIISAIITIPLLLLVFYLGGIWLFLLILLISIGGFNELEGIIGNLGNGESSKPNKFIGYMGIFLIYLAFFYQSFNLFILAITVVLLISVAFKLAYFPRSKFLVFSTTLFSIFYITWTFGFLISIRNLPNGFYFVLFLLFVIWATDTGAYFTGISLGKNKLAPEVSPKKSIEGSIGGLIIAVIVSLIIGMSVGLSFVLSLLVGIIVSILSQLGDLMQSTLKRTANIKDSGNVIPGHGGLLDRFDSFLLAPSVFYVILRLIEI
ncbi:phosphatidate cytidylyltransferase [Natranaerofaba carboxydovora]|uniref:phosphatidate cytidylyltransferase n=1 Tax=Natranaerofaba carboxydovora TaxID=2742683 RepID=UPI001F143463|nr:phosphatidate cytidylyltransferase [Natranaerofaba carboxydovora]UMZ73400.1 Phosphatidate cytidylyltransferase [Natranaerofaba carboxydovora]